MGWKGGKNLGLWSALLILLVGFASSDINQDKTECSDKLVGLVGCLTYVNGEAKNPSLDCCTGLKEVIDKSKRCLCILIKDHDDPGLGLTINLSLALNLPTACKTPTNITQCVDLLHLPPNSPEAKVFEGYEKSLVNKTASSPASSATANGTNTGSNKNDGGWLVAEMVCGILPFVFLFHLLLFLV
ncbi:hypothetical protein VNO78_11303 [Psophocarpus tetragonolobus]|uniref:Bifunctional inhibitor/plant lipid transfer protein/seed storage helical domain-containing protein n=1 Tax=Psophocarpus tetragonolobus TaxID=3891 RepID=A0AAN9XN17_PSOTE